MHSFNEVDENIESYYHSDELLNKTEGLALFSGTTNGLFGKLFNKGKFNEIK